MSKYTATIALDSIEKIQLYVTKCTRTLSQVKFETGADYILNGGLWNPDLTPCVALKVDGKLLSQPPSWSGIYGFGWGEPNNFKYTNDTIHRQAMDWASKGVMTMIHAGVKGMEAYCVLSPAQISKEQKELLEKNYVNLKNQIIKNNAYFETYVFSADEECVCTGPLYG